MIDLQSLLFPEIDKVVQKLKIENISEDRKEILQSLIDFIQERVTLKKQIRLNFICTHNSRRSHLAQVWAQTAAHYYNLKNVYCYSGGTETTTVFPMIVTILKHSGFKIKSVSEGYNPIYLIKYATNEHPLIAFSKIYDDDFNPKSDFAAIMTCSQADEGCPFVAGSEKRISITYDDPKLFDNTLQQKDKYQERNLQIATEIFYVFSKIKSK